MASGRRGGSLYERLDDMDRRWLAGQLAAARALVREALGEVPVTAPALDLLLGRPGVVLDAAATHALGAAYGQDLVERLGFQWRAFGDRDPPVLVVIGPKDAEELVIDPFSAVRKRAAGGPGLDDAVRGILFGLRKRQLGGD